VKYSSAADVIRQLLHISGSVTNRLIVSILYTFIFASRLMEMVKDLQILVTECDHWKVEVVKA
jgi:hypothetical protein